MSSVVFLFQQFYRVICARYFSSPSPLTPISAYNKIYILLILKVITHYKYMCIDIRIYVIPLRESFRNSIKYITLN